MLNILISLIAIISFESVLDAIVAFYFIFNQVSYILY